MADAKKTLEIRTDVTGSAGKELKKLGKTGKKTGDSIAKGFIKAQVALGGLKVALRGLFRVVKSFTTDIARQGDEIAKMSKRLGIGVETLSEFQFVAERSGLTFSSMANAFKLLSKNAFDASKGMGEAKDAFEELGVEVVDNQGKLKDAKRIFLEIIDAYDNVESSTARAALAQRIFGRSGIDLVPVLNMQRSEIEALIVHLHRLGGAWTKEGAEAAEAFQDAMTNLDTALKGIKIAILTEFGPVITKWLNDLAIHLADNRDEIREWARNAVPKLEKIAAAFVKLASAMASVVTWSARMLDNLELARLAIVGTPDFLPPLTPEEIAKFRKGQGGGAQGPAQALPLTVVTPEQTKEMEHFAEEIGGILEALQLLETSLNIVAGGIAQFVDDVTFGTKKLSEAFRDMARSILRSLQRMALNQLFQQLIGSVMGAVTPATQAGTFGEAFSGALTAGKATPMAEGGIVTRPTFAMVGERGPEAIIPLGDAPSLGGITVQVVAPPSSDPAEFGKAVAAAVDREMRNSFRARSSMRAHVRGGLR